MPATPGDGGPQRLGQTRHGRGRAHGVAVAAAADHRRLRLEEGLPGQPARPDLLAKAPHVGAAAQRSAPEMPGQHRPAGHDQGRQVDRGRRNQQGRDRLVAAAEQHHPVDRVGPQQLLGGHGGQVAPEHGRRPHQGLAQQHHQQVQRHPAASQTPSLTLAATSSRWLLQGVRSEAVLAMAMWGARQRRAGAGPGASTPGGHRRSGQTPHTIARSAHPHARPRWPRPSRGRRSAYARCRPRPRRCRRS